MYIHPNPTFASHPRCPDNFLRFYDVDSERIQRTLDRNVATKLLHEGRTLDGIDV